MGCPPIINDPPGMIFKTTLAGSSLSPVLECVGILSPFSLQENVNKKILKLLTNFNFKSIFLRFYFLVRLGLIKKVNSLIKF